MLCKHLSLEIAVSDTLCHVLWCHFVWHVATKLTQSGIYLGSKNTFTYLTVGCGSHRLGGTHDTVVKMYIYLCFIYWSLDA